MPDLFSKGFKLDRLQSLSPFRVRNICQAQQKIVGDSINKVFVLLRMREGGEGKARVISRSEDCLVLVDCLKQAFRVQVNCCCRIEDDGQGKLFCLKYIELI